MFFYVRDHVFIMLFCASMHLPISSDNCNTHMSCNTQANDVEKRPKQKIQHPSEQSANFCLKTDYETT